MTAPANRPWLALRYVSKVEIVPGANNKSVFVTLEEDNEYVEFSNNRVHMICQDRKLRLTDETVNFHYDYPDDFKKLVSACGGLYPEAYRLYKALQKPVPSDWDKDGELTRDY